MNRMIRQICACALTLSLLNGLGPAFAQDYTSEIEKPGRAADSQKKAVDSARASQDKAAAPSDRIAYEQIFKDPDNIELNYKYAQQQVAEGDVRGASATLERILLIDPALPRVRLFYAVVLYRLGSFAESQRELNQLKDLPMPDSLRAEIDEYLGRIKSKLRRTNISARFGLGFQYDSNRNAAPTSGQRLFANVPLTLTSGLREDDQALIAVANIAVVHDLGVQAGHTLNANYNFYRAEQTELDTLDFEAHSWSLGGTYKTAVMGDFKPSLLFSFAQIDNTDYLRSRGFQLAWKKTLTTRLSIHTGFSGRFEEYIDRAVVNATDRTGHRTQFWYGGRYVIGTTHRVGFRHLFDDKDARRRFNAFQRHQFMLNHQWLLGKGRFLLSTVMLSLDLYDTPELLIANAARRDASTRLNFTYGQPLGMLWKPLKDLIWTVTYEYFKNSSNITNYDYDNHKVNMMFTYKWDY